MRGGIEMNELQFLKLLGNKIEEELSRDSEKQYENVMISPEVKERVKKLLREADLKHDKNNRNNV